MPNLRTKTWTTTTPANVADAQYWEDHLISDEAAAKAASSVQTVNSTAPDANGNVDVVALPAGGTVGQVLTKKSSADGDADWETPASSGHTILDDDGTTMTQQQKLQFTNADVTNDSVNGKTVVDCKGAKGDPGQAATINVGTVTTLPAGSDATVTNSGTTSAAVFNFGIPKGADGSGSGDMAKSDYDSDSSVLTAGGIAAYVAGHAYSLPIATTSSLGGIKVGTNLSIDENGVLSATSVQIDDATTSASKVWSSNKTNTELASKASSSDLSTLSGTVSSNNTAQNNKHNVASVTVDTTSWNTDTTSQSGTTLYKKSISLNHVYSNPIVDIGAGSGAVLPTTAQQEAYDLLEYVTVDGTTMYLYASDIPTDTFYINVEGVD